MGHSRCRENSPREFMGPALYVLGARRPMSRQWPTSDPAKAEPFRSSLLPAWRVHDSYEALIRRIPASIAVYIPLPNSAARGVEPEGAARTDKHCAVREADGHSRLPTSTS
jgi:hypothetical protein